jgi:Flp pilus assembly protein TadD
VELDPNNAACHQNRAVALLLGGDIEGSRAAFRTAITLLETQGRPVDAQALRTKAQGIVKLDLEPIA